jgi:hypothetical protein
MMAGAGLLSEKSTAGWLLVVGLFGEISTIGWWLISQANRALNKAALPAFHSSIHDSGCCWIKPPSPR